jgi:hypothetical protein
MLFLPFAVFDGVTCAGRRVTHEWQEGLDDLKRRDVGSIEVLEVFSLELDVFERGESGKSRETEEGDLALQNFFKSTRVATANTTDEWG